MITATTKCEPFLSKRNLYPAVNNRKKLSRTEKILFQVLYYSDKIRISDINVYLKEKPKDLIATVKLLEKNSLIKFN